MTHKIPEPKVVPLLQRMFICYDEDMHPYNCNGDCIHCRRESTPDHRVRRCVFCQADAARRKAPRRKKARKG